MSQSAVVTAFRKRALNWGYCGLRIYRICDEDNLSTGRYSVFAVNPLSGFPVYGEFDEYELCHMFRR